MKSSSPREEARKQGLKTYAAERPCKRGHYERRVNSGDCVQCARERAGAWRKANPEREKERVREWTLKNPDRRREISKSWDAKNPGKSLGRIKIWCNDNPEVTPRKTDRQIFGGPPFDIRQGHFKEAAELIVAHHGYASCPKMPTYVFTVWEDGKVVAAYTWGPPPPGPAQLYGGSAPHGVLALTRMCALPKDQRRLKHVSKPLMWQMKHGIDRTRWPTLLTYSDSGQGHTGYVYQCSGWEMAGVSNRPTYTVDGARLPTYSGGKSRDLEGAVKGKTELIAWVHVIPELVEAFDQNWVRVPRGNQKWASGSQAYKFVPAKKDENG